MGHHYPSSSKRVQIQRIIQTEEERFGSTLARGMNLLDDIFAQMDKDGLKETRARSSSPTTPTASRWTSPPTSPRTALHRGPRRLQEGHGPPGNGPQRLGKSGQDAIAPVYNTVREQHGDTEFVGYESTESTAEIKAIIVDKQSVAELNEGQHGEIILDRTPFYAESGGQVGDTGVLDCPNGNAIVMDVKKVVGKMHCHQVRVNGGVLKVGDKVEAIVDTAARRRTEGHHSATHLLQAALQNVIGDHVHQAGSLVSPERLRFDFTHFEGIDADRLDDIERLVNDYIRRDEPVQIEPKPSKMPRAAGATAFGESTMTSSASSAWAISPWSCAAAPTSPAPASSATARSSEASISPASGA